MAYIINQFGVLHTIPDDWALPAGARTATAAEIREWEAQDAANKAVLLAAKQEARQRAAQVVVVAAEPDEPRPVGSRRGKAKADEPTA